MSDYTTEFVKRAHMKFMRVGKIRKLYERMDKMQKDGQFTAALLLAQDIESQFQTFLSAEAERAIKEAHAIDMRTLDIPDKDKEEINIQFLKMLMCCDVIESAVMEMDSVLKRNDDDLRYAQMDDILQLKRMVADKLKAFSRNAVYLNTPDWGYSCDDMDAMMTSKAKKLHAKYKNIEIEKK